MNKKFLIYLMVFTTVYLMNSIPVQAQSADTRTCNCFAAAVASNFAEGTKVFYGTVGIVPRRNDELRPNQSQAVRFVIPRLVPKQVCGAVYKIYITDESGAVAYEAEDSHNEFSYTFEQCNKRYEVRITASVTGEGNCTRRTNFYINPVCNTNTCHCDPAATGGKISGTSINMNVEGKLTCSIITSTRRSYTLQYQVTNKSRCRMVIESVTVLGETVSSTAVGIPAGGKSAAYNMSMSTALSQAAPSDSSVNFTVRYKVNERSCIAIIKLPYQSCR
jgi:hypothetical protein